MEWTLVTKRNKKSTPIDINVPIDIKEPEQQIHYHYRLLTKKDISLTESEQKMVDDAKLNIFCWCCNINQISNIINRRIYRCFSCYCCSGDEGGESDYDIYVCDELNDIKFMKRRYCSNLDFNEEFKEYDDYMYQKDRKIKKKYKYK